MYGRIGRTDSVEHCWMKPSEIYGVPDIAQIISYSQLNDINGSNMYDVWRLFMIFVSATFGNRNVDMNHCADFMCHRFIKRVE